MTDCAHQVYDAIRSGRGEDALARQLPQIENAPLAPDAEDIQLACVAGALGARLLSKEPGAAALHEFLQTLDGEWLAEWMDQRWLALAVDCTDAEEAARFGLGKFARVLDRLEAPPARVIPAADRDLIQLLETTLHGS